MCFLSTSTCKLKRDADKRFCTPAHKRLTLPLHVWTFWNDPRLVIQQLSQQSHS